LNVPDLALEGRGVAKIAVIEFLDLAKTIIIVADERRKMRQELGRYRHHRKTRVKM
jgi:hypothetical protein